MAASRTRLQSNPVAAAVAESLARHVPPDTRLALALSGGVDSVALLHALVSLRDRHPFRLRAVHVHHGLSPHAGQWADFCARRCDEAGVELTVHRVVIAAGDSAGVEAAARRARHRVFAAVDADFLLTAHQQDDQAETLLLQLLRGAGPKGLAAMPELRRRPGWRAAHLRPLLGVARSALVAYARAHGQAWVEDDSNVDVRYRRNALRQEIIPRIAGHFPGAVATLARAAALQADAAGLLDELARLDAASAIDAGRLDCAQLARLSHPRARNVLRHFIELHGQPMPSARRLEEALRQLLDARQDAQLRVRLGAHEIWRFRGGAYLVPPAPPRAAPVRWRGEVALYVPSAGVAVSMDPVIGAGLKRSMLESGDVMLGVRQGGERLRVHADGPCRSLKNLLQERGIPPWRRDRMPLLWCDGRLLWAADVGMDADARAAVGEAGILPRAPAQPESFSGA